MKSQTNKYMVTLRSGFSFQPIIFSVVALALSDSLSAKDQTQAPNSDHSKPRIEVCFVLDTTGSMGGLIEGAKQKIWSIANEIVSAKPTPQLKLGLIGYRDRGDAYITQRFDLTATAQYMIHLGSDIESSNSNDAVVFTKKSGVELVGHLLFNISLNYKLADLW